MNEYELLSNYENNLKERFDSIDKITFLNQKKVLEAFRKNEIQTSNFAGTSGYGYSDKGREGLNKLYCSIFNCEKAIVSPLLTCGTHTLATALFGVLRPHDILLSVTGTLYDTMKENILGTSVDNGSLKDMLVKYEQVELKNEKMDLETIFKKVKKLKPKLVYIQRSRGYSSRSAFSIAEIKQAIECVKTAYKDAYVMVDNCYGTFMEQQEPTDVGADICVGSLIKNAGGGIAPTGGYIVGTNHAITLIENRLTCPSLGAETGSYEYGYRLYYQGLFLAPHVTSQAIKGAYLIGEVMKAKGYNILPRSDEPAYDIIKSVIFNTKEELIKFVQLVQKNSPVDSQFTPEPWDMPGYEDPVIMAAGTFVSGASIELSCDSPIRSPYIAYFQGGLTYEHIKCLCLDLMKNF